MALEKVIKVNGVPMGYHRILFLTVDVNVMNTIGIMSYVDSEGREAEQEDSDEEFYKTQWFVETEYDPNMSVNSAYEYLKTLAEFDGADDVIEIWQAGVAYYIGDICAYDGKQWECRQSHTSQEGWEPTNAPALWAEHDSGGGIPEWHQPDSTNPYMTGDKVKHNGKIWVSDVDNNVWEPGVYGWTEV